MASTTVQSASASRPAIPRLAFAALIIGNVLLPFGPLFVRMAEVGPVASAFWRVALAVPMLFLFLFMAREKSAALGKLWWVLLLAGLFFAADLAAWHLGILHTKLANATLFGNSASLFYPIYGFLIARSWPNKTQATALCLATVGAGLLLGRSYDASFDNLIGDLFCLLAGLFYTFYFIAMARARGGLGPWSTLVYPTIAAMLPLLAIAWLMGEKIWPDDWTPLLGLALCSQVLGQGLMTYALAYFSPLVIGIVLLVQPIISGAIGWVLYDERLGMLDFIGAIAVALALVLVRQADRGPIASTAQDDAAPPLATHERGA